MKALNRHGCYRIWYIVYNLLISYLLQYKYLHFIEILDEIIEEIVGEAVGRIRKRFPDSVVNVSVPEEMLIVPMDATLIEQVLINLI